MTHTHVSLQEEMETVSIGFVFWFALSFSLPTSLSTLNQTKHRFSLNRLIQASGVRNIIRASITRVFAGANGRCRLNQHYKIAPI